MKRRAIVGAVLVLNKTLEIEFESDEHLQAQIIERLQGDGVHGWNRSAFDLAGANIEIAEIQQEAGNALLLQQQQPTQQQLAS